MMDDFDDLNEKISQMIDEVPDLVEKALFEEATIVLNMSQELVPVDTGRLRNTGRVTVEKVPNGFSAAITYSTDYAIYVHEDLTKYHKFPTQAKFLEQPARERLPNLLSNISKRVERMLSK
jgi:hypothetical protein